MTEYQLSISYQDFKNKEDCHIAPFVDKAAFESVCKAVEKRGYTVSKAIENKVYGNSERYYAEKDGQEIFIIGYKLIES